MRIPTTAEIIDPNLDLQTNRSTSLYQRAQPWVTLIATICGVALVGSSFVGGRALASSGLLLIAIGLAARLPLQRFFSIIFGFFLWSLLWFAFSVLRGIGDDLGSTAQVDLVANVERWLFGGQLPSSRLQNWFYDPMHPNPWDWGLGVVYASFFATSSIVAVIAIVKNSALFRAHVRALALLLLMSCGLFALIPTNPPWLAVDEQSGESIDRAGFKFLTRFQGFFKTNTDGEESEFVKDSNELAAMPSIHFASTVLLFFLACRFGRRHWQLLTLTYASLMGIALIYLGEHYFLDIAAGLAIAVSAWKLGNGTLFTRRTLLRLRNTTPGTYRKLGRDEEAKESHEESPAVEELAA